MINKNTFAPTAPMGWNSWDCYGAAVTEEVLLKNTDYMAEHLKSMDGNTSYVTSSGTSLLQIPVIIISLRICAWTNTVV